MITIMTRRAVDGAISGHLSLLSVRMKISTIVFAILALAVAFLVGKRLTADPNNATITILTKAATLDKTLEAFKSEIGDDMPGYRNHCLRVLSFALHHLGGPSAVDSKTREIMELAVAYHDIALWTEHRLDYVIPSGEQAVGDLKAKFDSFELDTLRNAIVFHHKVTPFSGSGNLDVINAIRKADWADATMGVIPMGLALDDYVAVAAAIPNAGFHNTLLGFGPRLYGWDIPHIVAELSQILYA